MCAGRQRPGPALPSGALSRPAPVLHCRSASAGQNANASTTNWQTLINQTEVTAVDGPVAGSFTVLSADGGALSSVAVAGAGGGCNVTSCSPAVGAPFAAGQQVACAFTCQPAVTAVTPLIDVTFSGAASPTRVNASAASVAVQTFNGSTACVDVSAPLLHALAPAQWPAEPRLVCVNSTSPPFVAGEAVIATSTPLAPVYPAQCPFGAPNFTLVHNVTLVARAPGVANVSASASTSASCPQPAFSNQTLSAHVVWRWAWSATLAVVNVTDGAITWAMVGYGPSPSLRRPPCRGELAAWPHARSGTGLG